MTSNPQTEKRIVILTEGRSNPSDAKTAVGMIRYRGSSVVAVLDTTQAGRTAGEVLGVGADIPFVSDLASVEADTLLIGIAPAGGGLPDAWRPVLRAAIERGMKIVSGLHTFIAEDEELAPLAAKSGSILLDVRKPPRGVTVSKNVAKDTPCFRVHTVGNDCNVGKMHTSIELATALSGEGVDADFVPTGQTGIVIAGWGIAIDCVVSDFISGAIESLVLERQSREVLVIEGQGSLIHPLYSGVTLGLLHGCAPQAMILCYEAGRVTMRHVPVSLPPLERMIEYYESMANIVCPSRIIAVSANTSALSPTDAEREIESVEGRLGLAVTDPVRFGSKKLVDAVVAARENRA